MATMALRHSGAHPQYLTPSAPQQAAHGELLANRSHRTAYQPSTQLSSTQLEMEVGSVCCMDGMWHASRTSQL